MDDAKLAIQVHIDAATARLLATVERLTDDELRRPSLLPTWSRAHVLTHVARTADALRNLLTWARTGVETPAYESAEARAAAIEAGAARSVDALVDDLRCSADAFRREAMSLPADAWRACVRVLDYNPFAAEQVLLRRWVELELHHCDLGAGYTPSDWPTEFASTELPEPMRSQREDRKSWIRDR